MSFEVEQKFPVEERATLEARLLALGVALSAPREERDTYYTHPARDFAATDEALRIRKRGEEAFITYKGPKIDTTTKTRREIDLSLPQEDTEPWRELLEALGFQPLVEVQKLRQKACLDWEGASVEISLDEVREVGLYLELEIVADAPQVEPAKARLASLAATLSLMRSERRSYLELLLQKHIR